MRLHPGLLAAVLALHPLAGAAGAAERAPTTVGEVEGRVEYQTDLWLESVAVTPGLQLPGLGTFTVPEGGFLRVLCPDGRPEEASGAGTLECPAPEVERSKDYVPTRTSDGAHTLVLSPRERVLTTQPTFRWEADEESARHVVEVSVLGGDVVWEQAVTGTELAYPEAHRPLPRGRRYEVTVRSFGGGTPLVADFEVVDDSIHHDVVTALKDVAATDRFVRAGILSHRGFFTEAFDTLRDIDSPMADIMRGEILWNLELPDLAYSRLERALEALSATPDSLAIARAAAELARVELHLGVPEASEHLERAITIYRSLPAPDEAERLQTLLEGVR